jgi:gluconate:H+ symporter, GntP family
MTMSLVLILAALIVFIVLATTKFKLHPFIALLLAALIGAFAYGLPIADIAKTIGTGFGNTLGAIGIVIVLGTIIGIILEKSGAAISMAEAIIRTLGERMPTLTVAIIGYIVSIPVFCDSGFVILNSLKNALAARMRVSVVAMSVALAVGLYATHTFVPPTPGPIAAAGNLGLESQLGLVILIGLVVAACSALAGVLWANRFLKADDAALMVAPSAADAKPMDYDAMRASYGTLPSAAASFAPIFVPIALICLGSVANFPARPFGTGSAAAAMAFLGQPIIALMIGVVFSLFLLKRGDVLAQFAARVEEGIVAAAPILLITGAGGAFGAVLTASGIGTYLGQQLSAYGIGLFMPFIVAAALKTAQGSSTVSLVTTSAMVAPLLGDLGLGSDMGRVLTVMAIGSGAMTVSHANDSYFWVVSQFSRMTVATAYRAQTVGTLIQGTAGMAATWLLSLVLL